jgi:hypothetical protein
MATKIWNDPRVINLSVIIDTDICILVAQFLKGNNVRKKHILSVRSTKQTLHTHFWGKNSSICALNQITNIYSIHCRQNRPVKLHMYATLALWSPFYHYWNRHLRRVPETLGKRPKTLGKVFAESCTRQRPPGVHLSSKPEFAESHPSDTQQRVCRVPNSCSRQNKVTSRPLVPSALCREPLSAQLPQPSSRSSQRLPLCRELLLVKFRSQFWFSSFSLGSLQKNRYTIHKLAFEVTKVNNKLT